MIYLARLIRTRLSSDHILISLTTANVRFSHVSDTVIDIVRSAAADKFNFSSIFMDEREGDNEPNFPPPPPPPTYGKKTGRGYVVYQTAVHYDPVPRTKSVNDYYAPNYNGQAANPTYDEQGYQQAGYHNRGYGQPQYPDAGPAPAPAPAAGSQPQPYPQGNIRETRSYGRSNEQPRNYRDGNRFGPGDQQRSLARSLPEALAALAFNDDDGPEAALQRAVAPVVDPPAALWRPFYPHAARHVADAVRHSR